MATFAWTTADVIEQIESPRTTVLLPPSYTGSSPQGIALAVRSMRDHMTDEGWQIMLGLEQAGYDLWGHGCLLPYTNVVQILASMHNTKVGVVVVQDKREWDTQQRDFRDPEARFTNVDYLARRNDLLKLTILKDAHQRCEYHRQSAVEMGVHGWIVYYHPRIVRHLAPYVRPQHLIRTYHTVDVGIVPPYTPDGRQHAVLSGALSSAYPLRQRLVQNLPLFPRLHYVPHPGYHRRGCATPDFLNLLSRYKVAICTASRYGYALRKIIEATAAGCVVITDLPCDDALPGIDGNLVRVRPDVDLRVIANTIEHCCQKYDADRQRHYAEKAIEHYHYAAEGKRLADTINTFRETYGVS